jgi:aldose 1-epimerase
MPEDFEARLMQRADSFPHTGMDYETLSITSTGGRTEASFVPEVNMLCCSLRHDGKELLDLRRGLQTYADAGKTMGIPLLYPWANRLARFGYEAAGKTVELREDDARIPRDSRGLPIHGVLPSLLRWEAAAGADSDSITGRLDWTSPELLELFPYRHEVSLAIALADGELAIATTVHANRGDPVPVSFGYHPYVRIPDSPRETWQIELGASRRLLLDELGIPTGQREPVSERHVTLAQTSWDDAFDGLSQPAVFSVAADDTRIGVTFRSGYDFAQVFAPADQRCICFEPMTAASAALNSGDGLRIIAAGEEHRAEFAIAVTSRRSQR